MKVSSGLRTFIPDFASTAISCLKNGPSLFIPFLKMSYTNNGIAIATFNIFTITLLIMPINKYPYMNLNLLLNFFLFFLNYFDARPHASILTTFLLVITLQPTSEPLSDRS